MNTKEIISKLTDSQKDNIMPWENNKYQKRLSSQGIPWDYQRKPSDSLGEFADKEYGKKIIIWQSQ